MFWCFKVLFNRRKHTASVSAAHEMAEFLCHQLIEINQLLYLLTHIFQVWAACRRGCFVVCNVAVAWEFMFWCFKVLFNRRKHTAKLFFGDLVIFLVSAAIQTAEFVCVITTDPYSKCGLCAVGADLCLQQCCGGMGIHVWCFKVWFSLRNHTWKSTAIWLSFQFRLQFKLLGLFV